MRRHQFLAERTNRCTDEWGGSFANRMRVPVEIVAGIRRAVGPDFVVLYRLSVLDLVEGGRSRVAGPPAAGRSGVAAQGRHRARGRDQLVLRATGTPRRIAVVGAGPAGFDDVVVATGVSPRTPGIPGIDHPMVLSYVDVLAGKPVGARVAWPIRRSLVPASPRNA